MLASKEEEGLGVEILFVLYRELLLKWRWMFLIKPDNLHVKVIKVIHGARDLFRFCGFATSLQDKNILVNVFFTTKFQR